jgi:hypothetical protein
MLLMMMLLLKLLTLKLLKLLMLVKHLLVLVLFQSQLSKIIIFLLSPTHNHLVL